jgi:hypothetical protein
MSLNKVRVQLLDTSSGAVLQEVDVLTSADSVTFSDGQTFQQKLDAGTLKGATGATGAQGIQGATGAPFAIAKTYASISAMNAGYSTDGLAQGSFVLIDTGNVNDADNAKLYVKGTTAYTYITDLSGATGMQGTQGIQGIQGVKGDTGSTGATGAQGVAGATGQRGSQWYSGTAITGTSTTAAAFSSSGITSALINDQYFNTSTGNVYVCTVAGNASTAQWVYSICLKGATGSVGATGATGAQGIQGVAGADGANVKFGTDYASGTQVKLFLKQM